METGAGAFRFSARAGKRPTSASASGWIFHPRGYDTAGRQKPRSLFFRGRSFDDNTRTIPGEVESLLALFRERRPREEVWYQNVSRGDGHAYPRSRDQSL